MSSQVLIGILIAALGLLLLARTTGLYDTGPLVRYVPSVFVLIGLYAIVSSRFRNLSGPLVLILFAGAVQLVVLDVISGSDVLSLWPILLIVAGLSILAGQFRPVTRTVSASRIDAFALLGGNEQRATTETFSGGSLTALFGGVELDLRDAAIDDPPARINVTALFGGIDIAVPREWNVTVDILPVLGGVEDDRPRRDASEGHEEVDLVITGFVAFGGVSVTG